MKILLIIMFTIIVYIANAQDLQLSQYDVSPMILNPAYTGLKGEINYRIVNLYRNQWDAVAHKSFISTLLSYDMNLQEKWGVGAYILNDNSSRVYNSFSFVASGANDITIGNNIDHHLNVGIQLGFILKSLKTDNFTFDKQYANGKFDTNLPTGENFEYSKRLMPEVNFGFSYFNTGNNFYKPFGGIAVFHCTNPKNNFLSESNESRLPLKYVLHAGSAFDINESLLLNFSLLFMKQKTAWQLTPALISFYNLPNQEINVLCGISLRTNDAIILHSGISYKRAIYRINYDFNISKLKAFSSYRGAVEFSITFFSDKNKSQKLVY
ncbi:MAG: PorP/SprF family type IX secretion system membrane protein [Bacteroidales bacterium]|nr:PorP/SprF family type IX secretion system membrane protein [Bacteroidales bacterium]